MALRRAPIRLRTRAGHTTGCLLVRQRRARSAPCPPTLPLCARNSRLDVRADNGLSLPARTPRWLRMARPSCARRLHGTADNRSVSCGCPNAPVPEQRLAGRGTAGVGHVLRPGAGSHWPRGAAGQGWCQELKALWRGHHCRRRAVTAAHVRWWRSPLGPRSRTVPSSVRVTSGGRRAAPRAGGGDGAAVQLLDDVRAVVGAHLALDGWQVYAEDGEQVGGDSSAAHRHALRRWRCPPLPARQAV